MPGRAERKLVTVLFADVVGATGLGEQLDVEPLREVFEIVFTTLREEAVRTGGVCQFLGDAVMAVFGIPATHEDDVDRALSAAVAMVERVDEINQRTESIYGARVDLRFGVNTGEVMVPTDEHVNLGLLTGDTLNVAARLQTEAEPGTIVAGERSVRASRSFRFEDRGPISVRGRLEPIHGYVLTGRLTSPRRQSQLIRAPLVGRDESLESLSSELRSVRNDRLARMITVVGHAGIGKSRLVAEFVDRQSDQSTVLKGRCLPFGEELALRPVADIWRAEMGALETDSPPEVRAKIEKLVDHLLDDPAQRADAVAGLEYTLDVADEDAVSEVPPRVVASRIRAAWRMLLTSLAADRPVLVVLEDLHWADPALLDLLHDIACCIEAPVLILCTARPSLFDRHPDAPIGRQLTIGPLPADAAASLFDSLVDLSAMREKLRTAVLGRAEGNPLFIEEILRQLIDEGLLVRTEQRWRVEGDPSRLSIPDTVQAVLAGRIDLLDADEKSALQCASVVGRVFWVGSVAALTDRPLHEVEQLLARLEERDLIRTREGGPGPEGAFLFNHVLTRDVAYSSLPRRHRSALHDRAARWLDEGPQTSRPDLLAHHAVRSFEEAAHVLSMSADERERLRTRALRALLQASAAARVRNSIESARHHARRASLLVSEAGEEARVEEALGEAAYFNYEGDPAWSHLHRALRLLEESGVAEHQELARLAGRALETPLRRPGIMVNHPGELEVFEHLTRALDWAGGGDSAEQARLLMLKSFWRHAYPATGSRVPLVSDDEALAAGEEAAVMSRRVGRPDIESAALDGVSANHIPDSNYAEAWKATHRRLALVKDIHDPEEVGDIHAMQCWIDFHLGHYRVVHHFADVGFERTIDEVPSVALHCVAWRGMSRFRLGDWDGVLEDLAIGEEILGQDRPSPPYFASGLWAVSAVVCDRRGQREQADELMSMLTTSVSAEEGSDTVPLATWIEFLGPVLAKRGQTDLALRLIAETRFRRGTRRGLLRQAECDTMLEGARFEGVDEVVSATRSFGDSMGLEALGPAADRLEGVALLRAGRPMDAIRRLRRSQLAFARLDAAYDVAVTEMWLAGALEAADSADPALLRRAIETLQGLGIEVAAPVESR